MKKNVHFKSLQKVLEFKTSFNVPFRCHLNTEEEEEDQWLSPPSVLNH
jgi:hypothetical protein